MIFSTIASTSSFSNILYPSLVTFATKNPFPEKVSLSVAALTALRATSVVSSTLMSSWNLYSSTPFANVEPEPVEMKVSLIIPPAASNE